MVRDFNRRLPMDTRVVRDIQRSPKMSAEQGPNWLSDFGGPQGYSYWAKQPMPERVTYFAVQEGATTQQQVVDWTGLRSGEVSSALSSLERKGLVEKGVMGP